LETTGKVRNSITTRTSLQSMRVNKD